MSQKRNQIPQVNANSLGELKRANASLNEQYVKINEILDYRRQETQALMQQLYTQVEDFRLNMHTELRREIEVSYDLAIRAEELAWKMRPWWVKMFSWIGLDNGAIQLRADWFLRSIKKSTEEAHKVAEAEMEQRIAEDNKKAAIREEAAKQAEIARQAQAEALKKEGEKKLIDSTGPVAQVMDDQVKEIEALQKEGVANQAIRDIDRGLRKQQMAVDLGTAIDGYGQPVEDNLEEIAAE